VKLFCGSKINYEKKNLENDIDVLFQTDGFYIALKNQTKSAKFSSPEISSGRACIGLWYSVSKTDDYTIIVYISSKSRQIKRLQNTGVYKWMHIYININPTTSYKVCIHFLESLITDFLWFFFVYLLLPFSNI
jgi:hypothetical protein